MPNIHPGQFVRETYLEPRKITVTEAAKSIGISRPGVSNFLNGRVSTTADMAARVERAFGVPASKLLDMQAAYDAANSAAAGAPIGAKPYVPPFLGFKANHITEWVTRNIPARIRLAVFLRTLVNSTGLQLEKVDFPGNDDAERPGWDGNTLAGSATQWVPAGETGWEFGVTPEIKQKADGDFAKAVKAHKSKAARDKITFIFVTPHNWPGKADWVTDMKAKKQWKDVRAYDSGDLEQWLEQSLPGQAWFANETERPSEGVRSLDKCWADWANVADPVLDALLFETAIGVARSELKNFLSRDPGNPLVINADSDDEALAFLTQIFSDSEFQGARDRVIVFDKTGVLPRLAKGSQDIIAVIHDRDVERELGPYARELRSIIIYPRNAGQTDPQITLEPLGYEPFRKGLEAMGCSRDKITALGNESGRSLTVLRRRLATVPAVQSPEWAADHKISSSLIPFVLAGAWNAEREADQLALQLLAELPFDDLERRAQELSRMNDAPVWAMGNHRGIVSKIDALFAIAHSVTKADLVRYLQIAKLILSEDDPALDLPESERWSAAIHGKRREFSSALREGIAETLVLLAVHGKHLFKSQNFDGEVEAARIVREILEPLDTRKLEANDDDLPTYAEAAPAEFLRILEDDLNSETPAVMGLLRPIDTSHFGVPCIRSGLLWALEGLAWNPATFMRTVLLLGRLSLVEINDNWANKPIASLGKIFKSWMPQTAADHDKRVSAVAKLIERYPTIGWRVCAEQFGGHGHDVGDYSHKPKWRPDGYGFGEPFALNGPAHNFRVAMVELALSRPSYTAAMICDLIAKMHGLGTDYREKVWKIVQQWSASGPSDADVIQVREKIRVSVLSTRARRTARASDFAALTKKAKAIYDAMEPTDLINKHEWLFRQVWVEESADELNDENVDFRERDKRIGALRTAALREIFDAKGIEGIFQLASKGSAQRHVGYHMVIGVLDKDESRSFIFEALKVGPAGSPPALGGVITGSLMAMVPEERARVIEEARTTLPEHDIVRLLHLATFERATWEVVDRLSSTAQDAYWRDVHPEFIFEPEEDNNDAVRRMLKAKRPRAAFSAVHFKLDGIDPSLVVQLLTGISREGNDNSGEYQLSEYDIKTAFSLVDRNPNVSVDDKAGLEFAYIDVLARMFGDGGNHIPNLERYIGDHPEMWVQALVWAYKRKGRGLDPDNLRTPEGRQDLAERGYRLLEGLERIPGTREDGSIDEAKLKEWVDCVRKASSELDREDVCDMCLGKLFSSAPEGADGVWPIDAVRDVIEELQSTALTDGAHTALYNARGVHWRGEGGGQERELAAKWRVWTDALQFTHPFLASSLLTGMVKTYEREAEDQDTAAGIRRRLRN